MVEGNADHILVVLARENPKKTEFGERGDKTIL